jgi:hypothetical protein
MSTTGKGTTTSGRTGRNISIVSVATSDPMASATAPGRVATGAPFYNRSRVVTSSAARSPDVRAASV